MGKLRGGVVAAACCMIAILPEAGFSTSASLVAPGLERIPAEPAGEMAALVGEYGSRDRLLTVYEENGRLLADGIDWNRAILRRLGPTRFAIESGGSRSTVICIRRSGGTLIMRIGRTMQSATLHSSNSKRRTPQPRPKGFQITATPCMGRRWPETSRCTPRFRPAFPGRNNGPSARAAPSDRI